VRLILKFPLESIQDLTALDWVRWNNVRPLVLSLYLNKSQYRDSGAGVYISPLRQSLAS